MATTSSPSLSFPSTSTPVKSNPHPYAIKTTSTGILTRSNSTTSTSSSHHFVPSSPSKHKSNRSHDSTANTSSARPRAHKYSRSLNSNEFPRPLPVPPNFPSSSPMASPTTGHFDPHFHRNAALTMSPEAEDTLPSSVSQPNLAGAGGEGVGAGDLPIDPRVWSPSQLSTYLASSSLRVTSGDVSPLVVQDIAAFVRTQKINGRKFLRLTEGDLDKYGLNQRWQSALLAASRFLRQDSLRGRIWSSSSVQPSAAVDQDEDNDNYSSTSSVSSSGSMSEFQRERAGSQSGRVKGMVASFERHGTSSSSSRSVSPTKDSTAAAGAAVAASSSLPSSGGRSLSPVKAGDNTSDFGFIQSHSRPRPQSDTFPSYSRPSFMSSNNSNDAVVTSPSPDALGGTPKKVEQPKRLLPLPPPLPHNTSPQPQFDHNFVSSFGPYMLPLQQDTTVVSGGVGAGTPFPQGVLPFSPQSTGTAGIDGHPSFSPITSSSPDDHSHMLMAMMSSPVPMSAQPPIYASSPQPQPQSFDIAAAAGLNDNYHHHHFAEGGVRPLPLPPHQNQFYQPLISPDNGLADLSNNNNSGVPLLSYSAPVQFQQQGVIAPSSSVSPHLHQQQQQQQQQRGLPAVPVPHVQIEQTQAPASFIPDSPSHHHHQQQHFSLNSPPTTYLPEPQQQPIIHAPQPRLGSTQGRDSPTKILEEKLEELLEPRRPRSRIFPGTYSPGGSLRSVSGASAAAGHSKSRSTPGLLSGGSHSRPRSRVASMNNLAPAGTGTTGGVEGDGTKKLNGSASGQNGEHHDKTSTTLGVPSIGLGPPPASSHLHTTTHPRTRVISLTRAHSHRLSGVEAWGESHRHIVVPGPEDEIDDDDNDLEIVPHHRHDPSNEDAQVKELEGEEEVGIEALLEKDVPPLPPVTVIPEEEPDGTLPPGGAGAGAGHGHARETSATGSIGTSIHSRAGSLREPKSAVITVIEHRRSSARLQKKESDVLLPTSPTTGRGDGEEEESIEALLAKADALGIGSGTDGSFGMRKSVKQRKRTPMNGAEAWEMVGNIDTVKHLEGAEPGTEGSGSGGLSKSIEDIFSPIPLPINQPRPPSSSPSQVRTKPKPKDQQQPPKSEDITEREMEKSIGETRKMVEEIKCRLDRVEQWISDTERREYRRQVEAEKTARRPPLGGTTWPPAVDAMRRMVLSASRVPGMLGLGLSAWLGPSTSSRSPSTSSTSSAPASTSNQTRGTGNSTTPKRSMFIVRLAKLGLGLSTYTVLFGISFCVIVLRMLGKRPGGGAVAGLGIRGGAGMANGNGVLAGR